MVNAASVPAAIVPAARRATWPRSPTPCAATPPGRPPRPRPPAPGPARQKRPLRGRSKDAHGSQPPRTGGRTATPGSTRPPDMLLAQWPDAKGLRRRRLRGEDPRQGDPHRSPPTLSGHQDPQGGPAAPSKDTARPCCLADAGERARAPSPSPPACSPSSAKAKTRPACSPAKATPSAPTAASSWSPKACPPSACPPPSTRSRCTATPPTCVPDIYGKIGNSGVSIATLDDMKVLYDGFDLATDHLGVDDHQRPGADHPVPHEHGHRPAARQVQGRQRPRPDRRRSARRSAPGCWPTCAARCRPTSSRKTRARTPASSRPSSRSRR